MQATLAAFCWGGQDELRSPDNVILIQGLRKQKSFQRIFSQHFQQHFVQIIMPVIKAEFGFFQVQVKRYVVLRREIVSDAVLHNSKTTRYR